MEGVDDADAILQNSVFVFNQRIGWQAACTFPDAHRTACGVKAQADLGRGVDRILQPRPVGIEVKVVRTKRTPRQCQFGQAHLGRDMHVVRREFLPNWVKRA